MTPTRTSPVANGPMKMPTIRRLWTFYKSIVLRDGLGITRRNDVQIQAQNAFYFGAYTTLQALAALLRDGDVQQVRDVIERHGRQLKKMRELAPLARRH